MAAACPPTPPAVVNRVEADYPDFARTAHLEGTAIARIDLDASGKVVKVSIQKSSGTAALDQAAIKASRESGYKAATDDCKPVASIYMMVVDFHE
jgi:protein TonB